MAKNINGKLRQIGGIAIAIAVAGISGYIISQAINKKKNEKVNKKRKQ